MSRCRQTCRALALCALLAAGHAGADEINGFDLSDPLVPRELIKQGGVERDGIPSIDAPQFVGAGDAGHVGAADRVLALTLNGITKAYPIKILNYHEIVNDRFGDTPVAVTFCPLCGTGIVFDARVDGQAREFGVSGLLYNSDVLMYDRQGESLWSQILGQAIAGPARGSRLVAVPARHTTWASWRERHPDTLVLDTPADFERNYTVDPYIGYAQSEHVGMSVAHRDDRYHSKTVVVGVLVNGAAHAWPFVELPDDRQFVAATVGGQAVRLEYDRDLQSATVLGSDGQEIPSFTAFWFAWVAFHPDTGVYAVD